MIIQPAIRLGNAVTISASGTTYSAAMRGYGAAYIIVEVTARVAAQTLDLDLEIWDEGQEGWVEIDGIAAAIAAVGTYIYLLGTGSTFASATLTEVLTVPLPRQWRLKLTTSAAADITFSIGLTPVKG